MGWGAVCSDVGGPIFKNWIKERTTLNVAKARSPKTHWRP